MIQTKFGDVLGVPSGIIVHGCNSVGVMGAGIALQIKNRFPDAFEEYKKEFIRHGLALGTATVATVDTNKYIVNAITQTLSGDRRRQVNYEAIAECFERVGLFHEKIEKQTGTNLDIVFPKIGAGLGGGNWDIISTIIDKTISDRVNKILYLLE